MPRKTCELNQDVKVARAKRWQDAIAPVLPKLHYKKNGSRNFIYSVTAGCLKPDDGLFTLTNPNQSNSQALTDRLYNNYKYGLYVIAETSFLDVKRVRLLQGYTAAWRPSYHYSLTMQLELTTLFGDLGRISPEEIYFIPEKSVYTVHYKGTTNPQVIFIKPNYVKAFFDEVCHAEDLNDNSIFENYVDSIPEVDRDAFIQSQVTNEPDANVYARIVRYRADESFGGKFNLSKASLDVILSHAVQKAGKTRDVLVDLGWVVVNGERLVPGDQAPDLVRELLNTIANSEASENEYAVKYKIFQKYTSLQTMFSKQTFNIYGASLTDMITRAIIKKNSTIRKALVELGYCEVSKNGELVVCREAPSCINAAWPGAALIQTTREELQGLNMKK